MKKIKNRGGFTLIELLAVIVVLAIIILMAATAVIPAMGRARKQVFAMEANDAVNAVNSYLMNNSIVGTGKVLPVTEGSSVCVLVSEMIESGDFDADENVYGGYIIVKKTTNSYEFTITMHNANMKVVGKTGDVDAADVNDYDSTSDETSFTCPTSGSWL